MLQNASRKIVQVLTAVPAIAGILSHGALGQDKCSDVLVSGVHNTYQSISKEQAKSSYVHDLCDESSSLNQGSSGGSGSISIFGVGQGSGGGGNKTLSDMRKKYCSQNSGDMSDDDFHSLIQVTIDPFIVQNWKECMQSQGKGLYGNVDVNGNDVLFTIEWQGFAGVSSVKVTKTPQVTGALCRSPSITSATVLQDRVDVTELCNRLGDNAVTFVVNTSAGAKTLKIGPRRQMETAHAVRYRPSDPTMGWVPAMKLTVERSEMSNQTHLKVDFTVPPPPFSNYSYKQISIYGFQLTPNGRMDLPSGTFASRVGDWQPGNQISLSLDVPSQFADPQQGWFTVFCIGSPAGCLPSPNLLAGIPIP